MNAFLGMKTGGIATDSTGHGPVLKFTEVTKSKSDVFFFAEENMWLREGCTYVLNDNALCGDGRDWFGTFHSTTTGNLNSGTANAVFVDSHVDEVRSGLKEDSTDNSEKEYAPGGPHGDYFEKYAWPHKQRFQ